MKKYSFKRSGSALLAAVFLLSFFALPPANAAERDSASTLFSGVQSEINAPVYAENEPVRIVIELEDAPLLEDADSVQTFSSAADYLASDEAQLYDAALAQARTDAKDSLDRSGMDVTVENEYSAVLNGLSVRATYGDLEAIQSMEGVKNAFVAERYELIEPVEYKPLLNDSVPSVGGDIIKDKNVTGKGTVVAILDTGLDISHEAFAGAVNSPKYTKDDIARLQRENRLTVGTLSTDALYKSEKVPYAYDYADGDTNVSGGESHGTHVAGIVGANAGETVRGVAPDAQFFIMKVFGDASGGAFDDDILAALDDAVKLGSDVINMSLGTPAGFSEAETKVMRSVYQRVSDAGVSLMVAAGNAYSSAYHGASGNDLLLTSNVDNSTVSSPSTYSAALSVASSNNAKATAPYILAGGRQIRYNDSGDTVADQLIKLEGNYPYVDCGVGSTSDFAGKNLTGKVALIERAGMENGEILTFGAKEENAAKAGAAAAIIYDNVEGDLIAMATAHKIPCVFISREDGQWMLSQSDKTVGISAAYLGKFQDSYSGRMSDFSSWGVTPDLKIKPEITAPGGNIYSTLPNGLYGSMSGTSMASPHMAGAAAVMNQYIMENLDGVNMTPAQRRDLANALMMSTAATVKDENGNPASPRKQGAGLVQLDKASSAKAYLTGADGGRPELSLGESLSGTYSMAFRANNLGSTPIKYQVSVNVLTEDVVTENGKKYTAEKSRVLTDREVSVTAPAEVTLGAGAQERISIQLALTEQGRALIDRDFPNGMFVEGFVKLTPVSGDTIELSIPFAGFYGDWADSPIFDSTLYDGEDANIVEMWLGYFRNYDGGGYILGQSQFYDEKPVSGAEKIAIRGGDRENHVTATCALLRNVEDLTFSVTNSGGELVYQESKPREHKSVYGEQTFYTPMAPQGWEPFDSWGDPLPDGQYTYTVSAKADGREQEVSFPVTIDSEMPQILSSEVIGSTWRVTVSDNHYVQAVAATLGSSPLTGWINPDESAPGATTVIDFDLSDPAFRGLTQAKIGIVDYADNQFVSDYYSLAGSEIVYPESVTLNKSQQQMKVGESTILTASVLPVSASNRTVTWTSSAPSVVSVKNGTIKALAEGEAVITAKTVNGLRASCTVTVLPEEAKPAGKAMASVSAPASVSGKDGVPFFLQLEEMSNVATVSFTFQRDSSLTGGAAIGQSGFTALDGIHWNGDRGTVMLSYLSAGAGGTTSRKELTDVAKLTFQTALESGKAGITLTGVRVSGYDETGKAVYFDSGIKTDRASVAIGGNKYDVNRDGTVDQLDITFCQRYYQAVTGDSDWNRAAICDVDGSGCVDVEDMVLILNVFQGL